MPAPTIFKDARLSFEQTLPADGCGLLDQRYRATTYFLADGLTATAKASV